MDPMWQSRARMVLRICTEVAPKIPSHDDSTFVKLVKLGSVIDGVHSVTRGQADAMHRLASQLGLAEHTNKHFVSLFFNTSLLETFKIRRLAVSDYKQVVEASFDGIGSLYFIEYTSDGERAETFYHTPGFDFERAVGLLWTSYDGRIQVAITKHEYESKASFDGIAISDDRIFGSTEAIVEKLIEKHRKYRADKVARTYLFVGPPGTAKSTAAVRIAHAHGQRLLQITAKSFEHVEEQELNFLLKILEPDFVVIDDLDKADVDRALPTILSIMHRFKRTHSGATVVITVNEVECLDIALLRPGRIDRIVHFVEPDENERRIILTRYLNEFCVQLSEADVQRLVTETEGLTGAYLREIASELRYDSIEEVLTLVRDMHELIEQVSEKEEETTEDPDGPAES